MPTSRSDPILYDHDAERALLGALLIAPEHLKDIAWFEASYFHDDYNALFYTFLRDHWKEQGGEADAITFGLSLLNSGKLDTVGGAARCAELMALELVPEFASHYAEGLRQLAEKRKGLRRAGEMAKQALKSPKGNIEEWGWKNE